MLSRLYFKFDINFRIKVQAALYNSNNYYKKKYIYEDCAGES